MTFPFVDLSPWLAADPSARKPGVIILRWSSCYFLYVSSSHIFFLCVPFLGQLRPLSERQQRRSPYTKSQQRNSHLRLALGSGIRIIKIRIRSLRRNARSHNWDELRYLPDAQSDVDDIASSYDDLGIICALPSALPENPPPGQCFAHARVSSSYKKMFTRVRVFTLMAPRTKQTRKRAKHIFPNWFYAD